MQKIHTIIISLVSLLAVAFGSQTGWSETCPSTIYYSNGQYLKSGSTFYYNNGQYARSGSTLYHSNGQYLKSGSTFYHSNGQYFKSGSTLYYPNGQYLRSGSTWFHENGQYLKSGSTFYYSNGQYARSGSTLYRQDGTRTDFPVTIRANIGTGGYYEFKIEKESESIYPEIDRFADANLVTARLVESPEELASFSTIFTFNTGHTGEDVVAEFDSSGNLAHCTTGGSGQPDRFQLITPAANVDVVVKSGYDPARVRKALQDALDAL